MTHCRLHPNKKQYVCITYVCIMYMYGECAVFIIDLYAMCRTGARTTYARNMWAGKKVCTFNLAIQRVTEHSSGENGLETIFAICESISFKIKMQSNVTGSFVHFFLSVSIYDWFHFIIYSLSFPCLLFFLLNRIYFSPTICFSKIYTKVLL